MLQWSRCDENSNLLFVQSFSKIGIIIGWILFFMVIYKASQVEIDYTEFDPYAELEIDRVSYF